MALGGTGLVVAGFGLSGGFGELDVAVLENRRGEVVGIEVKASSTVGPDDFRGLRHLAARTGGDFIAGVVLYTGTQTLPFGPKMRAMPAAALWEI